MKRKFNLLRLKSDGEEDGGGNAVPGCPPTCGRLMQQAVQVHFKGHKDYKDLSDKAKQKWEEAHSYYHELVEAEKRKGQV